MTDLGRDLQERERERESDREREMKQKCFRLLIITSWFEIVRKNRVEGKMVVVQMSYWHFWPNYGFGGKLEKS